MNNETLVPIILGVALSGLSTLMSFAYGSIDELHDEMVNHRVLLSKLISPDGVVIQSPTSANSKSALKDEIYNLKSKIVKLETQIEYLERSK